MQDQALAVRRVHARARHRLPRPAVRRGRRRWIGSRLEPGASTRRHDVPGGQEDCSDEVGLHRPAAARSAGRRRGRGGPGRMSTADLRGEPSSDGRRPTNADAAATTASAGAPAPAVPDATGARPRRPGRPGWSTTARPVRSPARRPTPRPPLPRAGAGRGASAASPPIPPAAARRAAPPRPRRRAGGRRAGRRGTEGGGGRPTTAVRPVVGRGHGHGRGDACATSRSASDLDGTLGYGDTHDLALGGQGTITGSPPREPSSNGAAAGRGQRPSGAAALGDRPMWRDARRRRERRRRHPQLEENLIALGYGTAATSGRTGRGPGDDGRGQAVAGRRSASRRPVGSTSARSCSPPGPLRVAEPPPTSGGRPARRRWPSAGRPAS